MSAAGSQKIRPYSCKQRQPIGVICLALSLFFGSGSEAAARSERVERIIAVDTAAAEILIAAGLGQQLVAVDSSTQLSADMQALPRLGYHRSLPAEGILGLAPDLVIGSTQMGPPHVIDALQRSTLPVLRLEPARSVAELQTNVEQILTAVGVAEERKPLLESIRASSARLGAAAIGELRLAFVLTGGGRKLRLAGTGTGGDAFVEIMGASNVATHANYRSVTAEALLALNADAIILADTDGENVTRFLEQHAVLRFGPAGRRGAVFAVDPATLVAGLSLSALAEAERVQQQLASVQVGQ